MTSLILASLIIAVPPADASHSSSAVAIVSERFVTPRTHEQWVSEVADALRNQAQAADDEQPRAFVRLVSLYQQVVKDDELHHTDRNRLRQKLRKRLIRIGGELPADLRHRQNRIEVVRSRAKIDDRPDKLEMIKEDEAILAQWHDVLGQVGGGFAPGGAGGAGGPAGAFDHGEELVELIQRVITPDTWDVNGGPSSIVYFRGLKVLVISATSEVHEKIGGLADGLRRAGN